MCLFSISHFQKALLFLGRSSVHGPYRQTATIRASNVVYILSTSTKVVHGDFGICTLLLFSIIPTVYMLSLNV